MKKLWVLCFSILLVGCGTTKEVEPEYKYQKELEVKSGINLWLKNFSECEFTLCDTNVKQDGFKFYNFYSDASSNTSKVSGDIYQITLEKAVDSVKYIKLEKVLSENTTQDQTENTESECDTYNVYITFEPYEMIEKLSFNEEQFKSLSEMYVIGDCTTENYTEALGKFYIDTYESCFTLSGEEETLEVQITECMEYNIAVVENIDELIIPLMQKQGVLQILEVYEENMEREVQKGIREYK